MNYFLKIINFTLFIIVCTSSSSLRAMQYYFMTPEEVSSSASANTPHTNQQNQPPTAQNASTTTLSKVQRTSSFYNLLQNARPFLNSNFIPFPGRPSPNEQEKLRQITQNPSKKTLVEFHKNGMKPATTLSLISLDSDLQTYEENPVAVGLFQKTNLNSAKEVIDYLNFYGERLILLRASNPDYPIPTTINLNQDIWHESKFAEMISNATVACKQLIQQIDWSGFNQHVDQRLNQKGLDALQHLPNLKTINFRNSVVTDSDLELLAQLPQLEFLNLSSTHNSMITHEGLIALTQGCHNLKYLNLYGCCNIKDIDLVNLARNCPNLEYLNLNGISLENADLQSLPSLKNLTCLDIGSCQIPDSALNILCSLPQLKNLSLNFHDTLSELGIITMLSKLNQLQALSLYSCNNITNATLAAIARHCQDLKTLELNNCNQINNLGIIALTRGCQQLKYLDLSGCTNITDQGFQAIAQLQNLEELRLNSCRHNVNERNLTSIIQGCKNLKTIDIQGCEYIDHHSFQTIQALNPQLKIKFWKRW